MNKNIKNNKYLKDLMLHDKRLLERYNIRNMHITKSKNNFLKVTCSFMLTLSISVF